jgi:hypothetical protein
MPEQIEKLRPDRDLQCYFYQPSAVAAMSGATPTGFTLSGTWRQQFDWAVIEWNRDNVYEHPLFRTLPDGDLSGLILSYQETRINCIPLDSSLYATVDWPSLRIWATPSGGDETVYYVPIRAHAQPVAGAYQCAYADFTLSGTVAAGDYIGLAFLSEHYTYQLYGTDTLESAVQAVADSVNAFSTVLKATVTGTTIRLYYTGGASIAASTAGANGNRFGVYSYTTGAETWDAPAKTFANGTSPTQWLVTLDFSSLEGTTTPDLSGSLTAVPTNRIRKMRWTYAADLQLGFFMRSEFQVAVTNWTVTGTNRTYSVAGTGSRRVEDDDAGIGYSGSWAQARGNYSGGTIHKTSTPGDALTYSYEAANTHQLYVGLRCTANAAVASITVDGAPAVTVNLQAAGEDYLFRFPLGQYGAGTHTLQLAHIGASGTDLFFDFVEMAVPSTNLPVIAAQPGLALATDWDTLHSLSVPAERTAWMLNSLGFTGRANHYAGALWFYELVRTGHQYASATVTFSGTPQPNDYVTVTVGRSGQPSSSTVLGKLIHVGDTAETVATAFALELNRGYTGVWASASGGVLTIWSRSMGTDGNANTIAASTTSSGFTAAASGATFMGGSDGNGRTDLTATPRLNRAARDWNAAFFAALRGYGIEVAASFSMELQHGDPSPTVGIAQVGPAGDPILLPTPSLQTNFSPASVAFWREVYAEMAALQAGAGLVPYLQFGEVQWWYFPNDGLGTNFSGMPFYDGWTQNQFQAQYGRPMAVITTNTVDPASYPEETAFLASVLGNFTSAIVSYVRASQPLCRFEVLYPTDVNQTAFNQAINFPQAAWTPAALNCLKTEAFGFTLGRNLDQVWNTLDFGTSLGFSAAQRSHLTGVGDSITAWLKEVRGAQGRRFESVVLFALDQFCLIGYDAPLPPGPGRSFRTGK